MMLLDAVTVDAVRPLTRSLVGTPVAFDTSETSGAETSTSLKVATYCAAALVENPRALTAGTTTVASAWYCSGCLSRSTPVPAPATRGSTMGIHNQRRIARSEEHTSE